MFYPFPPFTNLLQHLRSLVTAHRTDKSQGEIIIHICNGAVNRPARDAALLHHAIDDLREKNSSAALRNELLMSRLVRFHWDRAHMGKVKAEYKKKNGKSLGKSSFLF